MPEPSQPRTRYIIRTRVASVTREKRVKSGRMIAGQAVFEEQELGWFILLEDSGEKRYIGEEEPALKQGQRVKVTIEPE